MCSPYNWREDWTILATKLVLLATTVLVDITVKLS